VTDAMVEVWQADAAGEYRNGFGRVATGETGACAFDSIKPGRVPGPNGRLQASHVNVSIFARGLLKRVVTRLYFAGDAANGEDPILALVPEERRDTLMARPSDGQWILDVHLCGERETVFFDV
jgi:protocatechuate 3,4-dioxygenase alpha subunit